MRRIGFVAELLSRNGVIAITAAISPYRDTRARARTLVDRWVEIYMNTPLSVCEARDPKGLYRRARHELQEGRSMHLTGVDDPYEPPLRADLVLSGVDVRPEDNATRLVAYLEARKLLPGFTAE